MNNDDGREILFDTKMTRPYTATGGRTKPTAVLDRMALVCSTRQFSPHNVDAEHAEVLLLCSEALSVAEVSVHMQLPVQTVRVLLGDLIDIGAVQAKAPATYNHDDLDANAFLLQRLLEGLERRL
jgi:hypothetical protein